VSLARVSPLKWRPPRRLSRPGSDPAYLAFVRTLRCCVRGMPSAGACAGAMEANHAGRRPGTSMKAADDTALPKCHRHHVQWTEHLGAFRGWDKEQRRTWADGLIEITRALYDGERVAS